MGVDKCRPARYTLPRKFVSGRGAIPHWRYSPRPLPKSADPVRLRGQRYSPDARNGRQIELFARPVAVFAVAGRVFGCLPGSGTARKGLSSSIERGHAPPREEITMKKNTTHNLTVAAMLSAVAFFLFFHTAFHAFLFLCAIISFNKLPV